MNCKRWAGAFTRPISPIQLLLSVLEGKDAESHMHIHAAVKQGQLVMLCIRHTQITRASQAPLWLGWGWLAADTQELAIETQELPGWEVWKALFCTRVFCLTIHKTPNSLALLVTVICFTFTFLWGILKSTSLGYWNCPFVVLAWLRCFRVTTVVVLLSYCAVTHINAIICMKE